MDKLKIIGVQIVVTNIICWLIVILNLMGINLLKLVSGNSIFVLAGVFVFTWIGTFIALIVFVIFYFFVDIKYTEAVVDNAVKSNIVRQIRTGSLLIIFMAFILAFMLQVITQNPDNVFSYILFYSSFIGIIVFFIFFGFFDLISYVLHHFKKKTG